MSQDMEAMIRKILEDMQKGNPFSGKCRSSDKHNRTRCYSSGLPNC